MVYSVKIDILGKISNMLKASILARTNTYTRAMSHITEMIERYSVAKRVRRKETRKIILSFFVYERRNQVAISAIVPIMGKSINCVRGRSRVEIEKRIVEIIAKNV